MASGLNKVMLLGNLGAEPELRVTPGGQAVLKMRLATTETYLDRNNERKEVTTWHSISLWGRRGEALAKFLSKGERIFIEGSIRTSTYEKDNEKRYRTEIVASNVILCGGRRGASGESEEGASQERGGNERRGGGGGGASRSAPPAPAEGAADDFGDYPAGDDEIPFLVDAQRLGWRRP